ncbi:transcriptional regulator [Hyphomonas adhaerens MHS-3]|uniref:Transcriptional regulator n=1 Tax=Hyphomonas adhaerens MHS-3 TaxID=1280949 RepID=A0A069E007_9PROT
MDTATETHPRERILQASLDLFSQNGFAGTSVRQIALHVGLKPSSLYSHFEGKEEILSALIDAYGPASNASRLAAQDYTTIDDPADFCRKYTADLLDQWCDPDERKFMKLLHSEPKRLQAHRAHFNQALFDREINAVAAHFRRFAEARRLHAPDPVECARLFMGGLTFVRMQHIFWADKPASRDTLRAAMDRVTANFLALTLRGD